MNIFDYYQVLSTNNQIIHVKFRGFWPKSQGDGIYAGAMALWNQAVESQHGAKYIVLADFTDCPVLSEVTKRFLADAMRVAKTKNLFKAVQYGVAAIARMGMGLDASTQKAHFDEKRVAVETLNDAMTLIRDLKKDM